MEKATIRVLHIITRLANGGADENTIYTVNGLDPARYDVDLLIGEQNDPGMMERLQLREGINLYQVKGLVREISPLNDLRAFRAIYRIIKENDYDLVHTHIAKAGVLGRLAAHRAGAPLIVHGIHGTTFPETISWPRRNLFKLIERYCGRFTDLFIPVGEDMKQKYIEAGVGRPEAYRTIYSGMELDRFYQAGANPPQKLQQLRAELGIGGDELVIGNVSKLQLRKGHQYFFQAAVRLLKRYDHLRFLAVGSGPDTEIIKQQAREMGLGGRVIFTGFRTDVADIFSLFDIKVLTSLWEGLPRVLVQAAAVGKPLVSFAVDGAWEIIEDGRNGFIVPMKDIEAMADRLSLLIENEQLRQKMGHYSRQKVRDAWSVEKMVEEIDEAYQQLIRENFEDFSSSFSK